MTFREKFGAPTVVARHRPGLSEPERARLLEVIDSIQNDAGVTLPEGIGLELLESSRSGSAETYRALAQWCNDEISRAVLGQTLTGSEGQRSGSMALGKVHEEVRREYIRADAALLMDAINHQLIRPLVALNFGAEVMPPRWAIDLSPALDLREECEIDRQLLQMGVSLPLGYFYEKYGRPAPAADGSRQLQYDDSNLYQYHLQFGILTVNEVRARLGLPPLPGSDVPTSPGEKRMAASYASGESGEDQPHGGVGEGEKEQEREKGK